LYVSSTNSHRLLLPCRLKISPNSSISESEFVAEWHDDKASELRHSLQFSFESVVEDCGKKGVEFDGTLGSQALYTSPAELTHW